MTYQQAPFFPHRRNPDGSFTSICLSCCEPVASHKTEEELVELDKKHECDTASHRRKGTALPLSAGAMGMRTPKVGDRVAIPGHALIFVIKSVNHVKKTVEGEVPMETPRIEKEIPWKMLTFIDP
jgi:hypothetical protein